MPINNKGERNPFYGKHHTIETRMRLSEVAKKRKATLETCLAISEAHKGTKNHMFGKQHTEDTKRKISLAKKGCKGTRNGKKHTPQAIVQMSKIKIGNNYSKGHIMPLESRLKMSKERKGNYMKEHWGNPELKEKHIKAIRSAQSIHPNKPETITIAMFNEIDPNHWKFVGDGEVVFGGRIPDIINVNGEKKICEVFGNYWHGERARCYEETEKGRIEHFAKYGYETLIIWEHDLKNHPDLVREKVREFVNK